MRRTTRTAVLLDWGWFLLWLGLSSAWIVGTAAEVGATFDEPIDLNNGLTFWRTGSHTALLQLGAMPLPMDLASLPAYLWERSSGEAVNFQQGAPYDQLFRARLAELPFWWLLLFYGRRIGRSIAGPWAGKLAVALLAVEPTLLAHASLATKDVAVTACLAAFVHAFRAGRDGPWLRRIGWPSCWFAATFLSKASALPFGPLCMLAVEWERLARAGALSLAPDPAGADARPRWRRWPAQAWQAGAPLRRDGTLVFLLGTALTFVYCGSDWQPQESSLRWARSLPDGPLATAAVWTVEHLRVCPNAADAILRQVSHNVRGHGVYILGHTHPVSVWFYFPLALTMKLTEPLLLLPVLLALVRPRCLTNWACLAALALLAFSLQCRVQIGVRLMLPLVGLAVPGLAAAWVGAWRELRPGLPRRLLAGAMLAGLGWSATAAALVWPNGLCYVNEPWGGTAEGYRCLSDANYDWGQGIPDLARWRERHGVSQLDVWYFGTDPAVTSPGFNLLFLHLMPMHTPEEVAAALRGKCLAVSTTILHGAVLDGDVRVEYLHSRTPIDRTPTFFIYDFR